MDYILLDNLDTAKPRYNELILVTIFIRYIEVLLYLKIPGMKLRRRSVDGLSTRQPRQGRICQAACVVDKAFP